MDKKKIKTLTKRSLPQEVKHSIKASQAKKGEDILVLDLREISSFTDFFVIMHGNSTRQNVALYESVEEELRKQNIRPLSVEGAEHGEWILIDYGSFIVHVFSKAARAYYSLEKLWGDAPKINF
jgi:ribosome-associated protein